MGYLVYSIITGISSNSWDTIAELTALAINSTPTAALRNTCAAISELQIFKLPVLILVSKDVEGEGEHLELVFGHIDDEKVEERKIKPDRTYGTLPKGVDMRREKKNKNKETKKMKDIRVTSENTGSRKLERQEDLGEPMNFHDSVAAIRDASSQIRSIIAGYHLPAGGEVQNDNPWAHGAARLKFYATVFSERDYKMLLQYPISTAEFAAVNGGIWEWRMIFLLKKEKQA
ncbi:MAG: hypothetical protein Q9170_003601 [Blastenia crenularia]